MRRILVTGGAGFIGSNFVQYVLDKEQSIALLYLFKLSLISGHNVAENQVAFSRSFLMILFSRRDTCTWEMPSCAAMWPAAF